MDHYSCEQCGSGATLCVSDWGYIAAFCDECLKERRNYMKLPGADHHEQGAQPSSSTTRSA
jgi:hypothetical protein